MTRAIIFDCFGVVISDALEVICARLRAKDPAAADAKLEDRPTAKRYLDELGSYGTNEVAINWNAPLVWVASFLADQAGCR